MPTRNTIKQYDAPAYYHIYNRGAGGHKIFLDTEDYRAFLSLLGRHIGAGNHTNRFGHAYVIAPVEILAYCLMGNHFHLFVYQGSEPMAIAQLMRSVLTAYTMYFNCKYKRQGRLFESTYKAARITNEAYFGHITRYIHMNPRDYRSYRWSSLADYTGGRSVEWLKPGRAMTMTPRQYLEFIDGYTTRKAELKMLYAMLADQENR